MKSVNFYILSVIETYSYLVAINDKKIYLSVTFLYLFLELSAKPIVQEASGHYYLIRNYHHCCKPYDI